MTSKLIVMFIWAGGIYGGPTTITGFDDLVHCERARLAVREKFEKIRPNKQSQYPFIIRTECGEL